MRFSKLKDFFFPGGTESRKLIGLFFAVLFLKFMWFNLLWCMLSTFTPFSKIETYLDTILVSFVITPGLLSCCQDYPGDFLSARRFAYFEPDVFQDLLYCHTVG